MNEWFNIDDCKTLQFNRIVRTFWRTRKCSDEVLWRWPKICPRGGTLPLLVVAKYTVCASKHLRIVSFSGKSDFIIFIRTRESRQELRKFMRNIKKSNPERGWVIKSFSWDKVHGFIWNLGAPCCVYCFAFCVYYFAFCVYYFGFCVYYFAFVSIILLFVSIILVSREFLCTVRSSFCFHLLSVEMF